MGLPWLQFVAALVKVTVLGEGSAGRPCPVCAYRN